MFLKSYSENEDNEVVSETSTLITCANIEVIVEEVVAVFIPHHSFSFSIGFFNRSAGHHILDANFVDREI